MKTASRIAARLAVLVLLAWALAACGNKGELVRPAPAADQPAAS